MNSQMLNVPDGRPSGRIAPLQTCLPEGTGKVRLMYDGTLSRPLRLRDGAGVKLAPEVHHLTLDLLSQLDALLRPLSLHYVGAELSNGAGPAPNLDGTRLGQLPRVLYAYAAAIDELQGIDLELRPSARVVRGQGAQPCIDTAMHIHVDEDALSNPEVRSASEAYANWAGKIWSRAISSTLGPWALGSGVTEFRLAGSIQPDRSRQLAVLAGEPINGGPPH